MTALFLRRLLMLAGVLPFLLGTLAHYFDIQRWWLISDVPQSIAMYALAIASFMSGIHWGVSQVKTPSKTLLLHSNLMVLLPWVVFAVQGPGSLFYFVLAAVFIKQVCLDSRLAKDGHFDNGYLFDRKVITILVSGLLVSNAFIVL